MKNKLLAKVLAFVLMFSILLPAISPKASFATGASTGQQTNPSTDLRDWADSLLGRSSRMFIDATFKKDDYPDFKDAYFKIIDIPSGYTMVRDGGTDRKPIYVLQRDRNKRKI